jgi:hypothetical protein
VECEGVKDNEMVDHFQVVMLRSAVVLRAPRKIRIKIDAKQMSKYFLLILGGGTTTGALILGLQVRFRQSLVEKL